MNALTKPHLGLNSNAATQLISEGIPHANLKFESETDLSFAARQSLS
jgi:hypothetical protein